MSPYQNKAPIFLYFGMLILCSGCDHRSASANLEEEKAKCRRQINSETFHGSISSIGDRVAGDRSGKMIVLKNVDVSLKQNQCEYFRYFPLTKTLELYVSHYHLSKSNYYNFVKMQKVSESLEEQYYSIFKPSKSDSLVIFDSVGEECLRLLLFE